MNKQVLVGNNRTANTEKFIEVILEPKISIDLLLLSLTPFSLSHFSRVFRTGIHLGWKFNCRIFSFQIDIWALSDRKMKSLLSHSLSISFRIIIIGLPNRKVSLNNNKWENPHEQREQVNIVYPFAYTKKPVRYTFNLILL